MTVQRREKSPTPEEPRSKPRGLYSVAQIQHILRIEFARAQRYRYPLACLLVAIDPLESVRDAHGYEVKEEVVASVVERLAQSTRASDFLGRTADDRLMAVVPHTSVEGARALAKRLIAGVRESPVAHLPQPIPVTLSVGFACSQAESSLYFDTLLSSAEAALAEAIAAGGDRAIERLPLGPAG